MGLLYRTFTMLKFVTLFPNLLRILVMKRYCIFQILFFSLLRWLNDFYLPFYSGSIIFKLVWLCWSLLLLFPVCWSFLPRKDTVFFKIPFFSLLKWQNEFYLLFYSCIKSIKLISIIILNYPCIHEINHIWSWCMILPTFCWIWYTDILLNIFASIIYHGYQPMVFLSCPHLSLDIRVMLAW